jgi:hypothetical protein
MTLYRTNQKTSEAKHLRKLQTIITPFQGGTWYQTQLSLMSDSKSSHGQDLSNDSYKGFIGADTFLLRVHIDMVHENVCQSLPTG